MKTSIVTLLCVFLYITNTECLKFGDKIPKNLLNKKSTVTESNIVVAEVTKPHPLSPVKPVVPSPYEPPYATPPAYDEPDYAKPKRIKPSPSAHDYPEKFIETPIKYDDVKPSVEYAEAPVEYEDAPENPVTAKYIETSPVFVTPPSDKYREPEKYTKPIELPPPVKYEEPPQEKYDIPPPVKYTKPPVDVRSQYDQSSPVYVTPPPPVRYTEPLKPLKYNKPIRLSDAPRAHPPPPKYEIPPPIKYTKPLPKEYIKPKYVDHSPVFVTPPTSVEYREPVKPIKYKKPYLPANPPPVKYVNPKPIKYVDTQPSVEYVNAVPAPSETADNKYQPIVGNSPLPLAYNGPAMSSFMEDTISTSETDNAPYNQQPQYNNNYNNDNYNAQYDNGPVNTGHVQNYDRNTYADHGPVNNNQNNGYYNGPVINEQYYPGNYKNYPQNDDKNYPINDKYYPGNDRVYNDQTPINRLKRGPSPSHSLSYDDSGDNHNYNAPLPKYNPPKLNTYNKNNNNNNNNNNNYYKDNNYNNHDNYNAPSYYEPKSYDARGPAYNSGPHSDGLEPEYKPRAPPAPRQHRYRPPHNENRFSDLINFKIPSGFPDPAKDPRAQFKKELLGAENDKGDPWGHKVTYSFRDPKNNKNYVEVSEVSMTVNDGKDSADDIKKFLNFAARGPPHRPNRRQGPSFEIPNIEEPDAPGLPSEPKFPF